MISEATILEFRTAAKEEYGVQMTKREAADALYGLTQFFDLMAQIDASENEYEKPHRQSQE